MADSEDPPLWGTVMDAHKVYEIRKGPGALVTVWSRTDGKEIGYVTEYEVSMAQRGSIPAIRLDPTVIAELTGNVINLRQAIGKLVRTRDPGAIVQLRDLVVTIPDPAAGS